MDVSGPRGTLDTVTSDALRYGPNTAAVTAILDTARAADPLTWQLAAHAHTRAANPDQLGPLTDAYTAAVDAAHHIVDRVLAAHDPLSVLRCEAAAPTDLPAGTDWLAADLCLFHAVLAAVIAHAAVLEHGPAWRPDGPPQITRGQVRLLRQPWRDAITARDTLRAAGPDTEAVAAVLLTDGFHSDTRELAHAAAGLLTA